ncbi:MAG TPA: hypothetical protein VF122_02535, partial [Caulobacteraceae bacterium]
PREIVSNAYDSYAGLAAYEGDIPEYVLGTDSTRPMVYDLAYYDPYADADLYVQAEAPPEPAPVAEETDFAAPVKVSYPPQVPRPAAPRVSTPAEGDVERVVPTVLVEAAAAPKPTASGAG